MIVRVLVGAAMVAALAAIAAGALSLRDARPFAPAAPSRDATAAPWEPLAATPAAEPLAEPLPPAPFQRAERPRLPAGILARAASARALERGPSCAPVEALRAPPLCTPEERQSIEIEWHVGPHD